MRQHALENSIKISSVFQIPAGLVPRKDQSTYNNQEADERKVWENAILSILDSVNKNFTHNFGLDKVGYKIMDDISNVTALVENESSNQDLIAKKLANLEKMKQLNPEFDINPELDKIYNNGR